MGEVCLGQVPDPWCTIAQDYDFKRLFHPSVAGLYPEPSPKLLRRGEGSDIGGGFGSIHVVDNSDLDLLPAEEGMHSGAVNSNIQSFGFLRGSGG